MTPSVCFEEAIAHSRRKGAIKTMLQEIDPSLFQLDTFGDVFSAVDKMYGSRECIGPLAVYDITVAICRHNNIPINRVYLIGNGPRRAAKMLDISPYHTKYEKITSGKRLPYIDTQDVIDALQVHGYPIDHYDKTAVFQGDDVETHLCRWQKGK